MWAYWLYCRCQISAHSLRRLSPYSTHTWGAPPNSYYGRGARTGQCSNVPDCPILIRINMPYEYLMRTNQQTNEFINRRDGRRLSLSFRRAGRNKLRLQLINSSALGDAPLSSAFRFVEEKLKTKILSKVASSGFYACITVRQFTSYR